jgi:hypothetical protein
MGIAQLGATLNDEESAQIAELLCSLTGEQPESARRSELTRPVHASGRVTASLAAADP